MVISAIAMPSVLIAQELEALGNRTALSQLICQRCDPNAGDRFAFVDDSSYVTDFTNHYILDSIGMNCHDPPIQNLNRFLTDYFFHNPCGIGLVESFWKTIPVTIPPYGPWCSVEGDVTHLLNREIVANGRHINAIGYLATPPGYCACLAPKFADPPPGDGRPVSIKLIDQIVKAADAYIFGVFDAETYLIHIVNPAYRSLIAAAAHPVNRSDDR